MTNHETDELAVARATNQRLNRRAQELEAELAAYRRAVAQWEINKRGTYIPHSSLRAIGLASGKDILGSVRHLKHFERVEQAEAAIERVRRLHDALDAETDLASPDGEITRGAAAKKIAAALDGWSPPAAVSVPPPAPRADDQTAVLAEDLRYVLGYTGPGHAHEKPGVWDTSGKQCGHCARLAVARQNLAAYDGDPDAVLPAPVDRDAEEHRLALSEALGLGTGAPWDAIHDRVTELGLPPLGRDPVARRLGLLAAYRATILTEGADAVFALDYDVMVGEEGDENLGSMREAWDLGTIHAEKLLRRMADEAQQPAPGPCVAGEQQNETPEAEQPARPECAHCWREIENRGTPNMGGPQHDYWVHVPGGFTPCFPQRGADSPRAEPRAVEGPE